MKRNTHEYKYFHAQLKRWRGPASDFNCIDCSKDAREWSHIHNTDDTDIENYEPRCRSCHAKYDLTEDGRKRLALYANTPKANAIAQDIKQKIKAEYKPFAMTRLKLAKKYGVSKTTVDRILAGNC